jgi:hypothetical protein
VATAMGIAEVSRSPNLTTTIIVAKTCVLATVALLAGLAVAPRSAGALPTYSQRENKPCEYCHINPAGGGDRNANGKEYEENGHKFKK